MLIDVVIPVYNCKDYLMGAVQSVLEQPYQGIEIILVDDGSTDGSSELCDRLATERPNICVIHQKNQGVSAARNRGIGYSLSKGEAKYIAFLDADDFWCANAITEEVVRAYIDHTDMYATDIIIFGGARCNQDATRFSRPYHYQKERTEGGNPLIWKMRGHIGAHLFAISLLKHYQIRFDDEMKYSEDKVFVMQCAVLAQYVIFIDKLLHIYRKNRNSAMSKINQMKAKDYYLPIIDGCIWSDGFLNHLRPATGREVCAGRVLSAIYFLDMAKQHYKMWGRQEELEKVFSEHPHYDLFVYMRPEDVSPKQYREHELLLHHPRWFRIRYSIWGFFERTARLMLRTKAVTSILDKKRYPLTEAPVNG